MRRILMWTEAEITGFADAWGLSRILTEVDEQGTVTRKLGFDAESNVSQRHPGEPTRAEYDVFDLAKIAPSGSVDIEPAEFGRLWST